MDKYVVTGCAGFIGSTLVDRLLQDGHSVIGVDNFSTGQRRFLDGALQSPKFRLIELDLLDLDGLKAAFAGGDAVFHLAANADVRFGTSHPRRDLEQNTIATYNVLEAMRDNGIKKIAFSSTGSVYGESPVVPTPEDGPFPVQTSLYGASKAAGEGLISAYCEGFGFQACIFRFVSILGERYTHGHVFDFYQKLKADPTRLPVLGNGKQRKSYLYVQDCIDAILLAMDKAPDRVNIFNLGVDGYCEVNDSIGWICEELGVTPAMEYTGGDRGWIGDNPFIFLDTKHIQALGWKPKFGIKEGVIKTVQYLRANEWVFESRGAMMKVCVQGLWHLGSVTAACLASVGHDVTGLDADAATIEKLTQGNAPLFEPGLDELLQAGITNNKLKFSTSPTLALEGAEVLWVAFDTPVDDEDQADVAFVQGQIQMALPFLADGAVVLVSSQMPVGSIRKLEAFAQKTLPAKNLGFACSPENLRLGKALDVFLKPDRIVVGVRNDRTRQVLEKLLSPITDKVEWMSVESAEMTKHAINAFLATSVTFANEIAAICELVGADAKEVERGLKTEARIGPKAYVSPGGPFAGGTLARDIAFLGIESQAHKLATPLLSAVRPSNDEHKNWVRRKLQQQFGSLSGVTIAIWGLTYKPGTDTLRRSLAVELCDWLLKQGAKVRVYDPAVKQLSEHWAGKVTHCTTALDAVMDANALVVGTQWPEFKQSASDLSTKAKPGLVVVDANRHLQAQVLQSGFSYVAVGTPLVLGGK